MNKTLKKTKKINQTNQFINNFYVIDTSALLFDTTSLTYFKDNTVILPISVVQELDKHKDRVDDVGINARTINRKLFALKKLGSLSKGVVDPESGVTIKLIKENLEDLPEPLDKNLADDRILNVCLTLLKDKANKDRVFLITNDINLALKAEIFEVNSFEFQPADLYVKTDYSGHKILDESDKLIINDFYKKTDVICPEDLDLEPNEFALIKNDATNQSVRVRKTKGILKPLSTNFKPLLNNIKPLNNEQRYALDLLLDPEIKLVTLTGIAGTGKSLVAIAAALAQTVEPKHKIYDRLIISRSLVVLSGKDKIGFLKGGIREKLEPYILPLKDAVDQVMGVDNGFEYLTASIVDEPMNKEKPAKAKIEIEPLQYIRGRSLRDCFFIIDEAQNLSLAEVKTIISRAGENCKIVLLGDTHQIDNPYLSKTTNGLSQVIERFKDSEIAGHVSLIEGVRSELATESADRL